MVIRPFEPSDSPAVASLFPRAFPTSTWESPAALAAYMEEMFLGNPWLDRELPSWVCLDGERLVGFIGVMRRDMLFGSRPVRVALLTQLMIEPEKRLGVAAAQLVRKALAGPQDLTISDGATDTARRMWERLGGSTSTLYTLQWRKLLRPVQYGLGLVLERAGRTAAALAGPLGAPVAALADRYAARQMKLHDIDRFEDEALTPALLLEAARLVTARSRLRPDYDARSLDWLLAQARRKRRYGELQGRLLRERNGSIAGWYLYYLNRGTSKVLQMGAREGAERGVLEHLFHHAWRGGATVVEGRMEPRFSDALGRLRCLFLSPGMYTLFHARDPELLSTLARGEAFFSRLDGEWWMRFHGEPRAAKRPAALGLPFPWRTGVRQKPAHA
ncbi:MAG TPA: GNAT family N-acetyltransferase [Burkholderiales bacterium]|nr:GNAT family N-acetyltransferase [Burkholderiales bacterium]